MTRGTLPTGTGWSSVCYGDGKFVAVLSGSSIAAYSTDGITWTETTLPGSRSWTSVCYGNGVFVAIATDGTTAYWKQTSVQPDLISFHLDSIVTYTEEGMTWGEWIDSEYNTVGAFADGTYVAVDAGRYYEYLQQGTTPIFTTDYVSAGAKYDFVY